MQCTQRCETSSSRREHPAMLTCFAYLQENAHVCIACYASACSLLLALKRRPLLILSNLLARSQGQGPRAVYSMCCQAYKHSTSGWALHTWSHSKIYILQKLMAVRNEQQQTQQGAWLFACATCTARKSCCRVISLWKIRAFLKAGAGERRPHERTRAQKILGGDALSWGLSVRPHPPCAG